MKRALITGSHGFVGRNLRRTLEDRGWQVTSVDVASVVLPIDARRFFAISSTRFDLVLHCAAVVGGRMVIDKDPMAQAPNLSLDSMMFEWAVHTGQRRVVYFSSSAVYPKRYQLGHVPYKLREDDLELWGRGNEPDQLYGFAKLTGEILADRARQAGLGVTVVRPFSGYGADQSQDYPFPAMIDRARRREDPFAVWGNGKQARDFIHISDIIEATLLMAEEKIDGPLNLGTGRPTSMHGLATLVTRAAGYHPQITPLSDKPSGVAYRVADVSQMNAIYKARISLEEGIDTALQLR